MKKNIWVIAFAMMGMGMLNAQERSNWRLSLDLMENTPASLFAEDDYAVENTAVLYGSATLDWSFNVLDWLSFGVYVGCKPGSILHYGDGMSLTVTPAGDSIYKPDEWFEKRPSLRYGLGVRASLLSLAKAGSDKWDVWMAGKVGGWRCNGNRLEYGVGAGAGFYLTRHFGIYAEYMLGSHSGAKDGHLLHSTGMLQVGLQFRH
ncbi:MAG: hypothetical protein IKC19_01660 [Bacteroidales bacterium]|nr:hypothetical protein [Bacteroidales bacterium]